MTSSSDIHKDMAKKAAKKPPKGLLFAAIVVITIAVAIFIGNILNNWTTALKERKKAEFAADFERKAGPSLDIELTKDEEKEISSIIRDKLIPPEAEILKEKLKEMELSKITADIEALRGELSRIREAKKEATDETAEVLKATTEKIEEVFGQRLDLITKRVQEEISEKVITKEEFDQLRGSIDNMKNELRAEMQKDPVAVATTKEVSTTALLSEEIGVKLSEPEGIEGEGEVSQEPYDATEGYKKDEEKTKEAVPIEERLPPPKPGEYVISPGDLIEVTVYEEPDLSRTVKVSPSGDISYPLLGRMKLAGLSISQVESKFRRFLDREYLVNSQVTVFVREYGKVSVLGSVNKPGAYELKDNLTLLDAIALAGGFKEVADLTNVKVIRTESGKENTIYINAEDITVRGDSGKNISLRSSDTVYVSQVGKVTIIGEVNRPGTYDIKPNMKAVEAITMAGGFTKIAAPKKIKIARTEDGIEKTIMVNVDEITKKGRKDKDVLLKSGDIIMVPESFF